MNVTAVSFSTLQEACIRYLENDKPLSALMPRIQEVLNQDHPYAILPRASLINFAMQCNRENPRIGRKKLHDCPEYCVRIQRVAKKIEQLFNDCIRKIAVSKNELQSKAALHDFYLCSHAPVKDLVWYVNEFETVAVLQQTIELFPSNTEFSEPEILTVLPTLWVREFFLMNQEALQPNTLPRPFRLNENFSQIVFASLSKELGIAIESMQDLKSLQESDFERLEVSYPHIRSSVQENAVDGLLCDFLNNLMDELQDLRLNHPRSFSHLTFEILPEKLRGQLSSQVTQAEIAAAHRLKIQMDQIGYSITRGFPQSVDFNNCLKLVLEKKQSDQTEKKESSSCNMQ